MQPLEPAPPTQPSPVIIPPSGTEGSNKAVLWLILGVVIIALIVGGVYLYFSRQQGTENVVTQQTPAPQVQENLENDLNAIDVANTDQEFIEIDQDLKNL